MRSRTRTAVIVALSAAACATALAVPAQAASSSAGSPALKWHACTAEGSAPGSECATLPVPLDYRKPSGPTVDIAVSRLRSDRPQARRGALLLISGGPGGSGVSDLARDGEKVRKATKGAYDIVSLDPRGVGGSTAIDCGIGEDDRQMLNFRAWPRPDGDISDGVARSRRIAEACARNGGDVLRSLTTRNQARDTDRFREALGEKKLSAVGVSYGTYVGAVYAQMFPERTDRWVLDSSADPDPARVAHGWLNNMSGGADDAFPDFARWAADPARGKDRLAERAEDVRPMFLALAAELDRKPRTFKDTGHAFTGNVLRQVLQMSLYGKERYPTVAGLIQAVRSGGDGPVTAPDPFPEPLSQRDAAVFAGIVCNDVAWPRDPAAYQRDVAVDRVRHPLTGGMPASITPCAFWKDAPAEKATRITDRGPSNILMVQNLRDPSTPHRGALKMREALGDRARLVSVDAGGHGVWLDSGNACSDRVVSEFLVTGERPARDTVCRAGH
ncbi:alpha/beta hydrolase [Streptomyces sp. VNUA116]|uniref:alpha/beta hydrolase n=1 Tax=Streptomyces sp. VNUA116 TaxID=3062449 RepID=UPI0026768996|nr:alpha/beta hydrolase [Streptomyces sp. VNUA116]WKU46566.1 alpha/beta hydrolase [Streptomyces sp. VNUA116]